MATGRLPAHRSPTPPPQPLSKRDKKRNAHQDKYQDLINDFAQNRDLHFRKQLLGLQTDMMLITQADPYQPEPMDDSPEGIARQVEEAAAGTPYQQDMSPHAGKWYSKFVQEVNQAKEVRDIELSQLVVRHQDNLARIRREYDFKLRLASEECDHLSNTLRERLAKSLSERKARLVKEKEHLDIADTNAILLHPSQFSITNPGSPGGPSGNRKTRHARHRLDDDYGSSLLADTGSKRKRKFEDGLASPTREGNSTPSERKQARALAQQSASALSFNSLFSDKDLKAATSEAYIATTHFFATSKRLGANNSATSNGKVTSTENDDTLGGASPSSSNSDLAAPEMDRTASQTYHATRSQRNLISHHANGGNSHMGAMSILSDLADKAATRPSLPYFLLANYPTRSGAGLPPPPSLMAEEQEEDLARMAELTSKPKGWVDKKLLDDLASKVEKNRDRYKKQQQIEDAANDVSDDPESIRRDKDEEDEEFWGLLDPRFPVHMGVHLVDKQRVGKGKGASSGMIGNIGNGQPGTPSKA
ncbi:putative deacetylase complex subunit [Phaeomoniella chlamydospora]|uniref:Putative deacetylase complex subunit n=1 Tax=Phaeomoniella chlamydospora TaxID=158046 RepID=A0A0G2EIT8_PHACM|nr:putative deacetylase complex subunit [Phaeomoniella chlamydospora]